MAGRTVTVSVSQTLGRDIGAFRGKLKGAVMSTFREEGEQTMTESKLETPVETGALRASGHVDGPHDEGSAVWIELAYGGAAAGYALIVHERTDVHHPVGKAKYLEDPAMRMADRLPRSLNAAIGRVT